MVIKHYLNGTEIDEPIGFDKLKMTMKRGDYHGMSAEVSELSLEFYGAAADIVRAAYQTDIDTEVTYRITADGEEMYSGVLDLSTYEEQYSEYCSVSCKVGEVGIKTTFNNRLETEIDLNGTKTLDGLTLAHTYRWEKLLIPYKTINYTDYAYQKTTTTYREEPGTGNKLELPDDFRYAILNLALDTLQNSEWGTFEPLMHIADTTSVDAYGNITGYFDPFFKSTKSSEESDDNDSPVEIDALIEGTIAFDASLFTHIGGDENIIISPLICYNGDVYVTTNPSSEALEFTNSNCATEQSFTIRLQNTKTYGDLGALYLGLQFENGNRNSGKYVNNPAKFHITIKDTSYVKIVLKSQLKESVSADTMFVHEVLNKVSETISENALTVQSSLYNRSDSTVNPRTRSPRSSTYSDYYGDGALRVITNGYKIRGLYTDGEIIRNMPLSFKDIIEAMNAIDCIGWGFEEEESGQIYVRVERWNWFYKTGKPILSINNPTELRRTVDATQIKSAITIGYKKYTDSEDIASIDNIMSERTFTTTIKAISNTESHLCAFIADNYAIELTRRAAVTMSKENEYKYDENIFIFSVERKKSLLSYRYRIPNDIDQADNSIFAPSEVYNAKLSPARMAYNWISYLFRVAGLQPYKCTSGKVNYKAHLTTKVDDSEETMNAPDPVNDIPTLSLLDPNGNKIMTGISQNAENYTLQERYYKTYQVQVNKPSSKGIESDEDLIISRVFKAETLQFTYPISLEEYKKVKANPYGLIEVDGVLGWIKEFTYSFSDGEATFKLIPKAD